MKRAKKLVSLLLALGVMVGTTFSMTACGGGAKNETITKLEIACMNAGLGSEWLKKAAKDFEEAYATKSYAEGKTGVVVDIADPTTGISAYFDSIGSYPQQIVFTEAGYKFRANMLSGYYADITDVVTDETVEGGSIESRIYSSYVDNFKGSDGKFYGIPHAEFYGGIAYNREVFVSENALIADDTCDTTHIARDYSSSKYGLDKVRFVKGNNIGQEGCVLSAGPDGIKGNEDDGLPTSLEQFIMLCDYLKTYKKISPIALSGQYSNMVNYLICGLWASIAGEEQMRSYYGLSGQIDVVERDSNGNLLFSNEPLIAGINYVKKPIVKTVEITPETGYLGNDMAAKYYAIAIAEILQKEGFYSLEALKGTVSHHGAQQFLIFSNNELAVKKGSTEKVAMLIDGSYFINETISAGNFNDYKRHSGATEEPDVRWMALPTSCTNAERKVEGYKAHASTLMDINLGVAVVNAKYENNKEKMDVAKDFLKFFYSNSQLKQYTKIARQFIPMSYSFDDTELKELHPFYQSLWKLRDNKSGSNVVYVSVKKDSEANTTKVFDSVVSILFTALQSKNLAPNSPSSNSPYAIWARTDNKPTTDGSYKYGSKHIFADLGYDAVKWQGFFVD